MLSLLEDPEPTPEQVLSEQVLDITMRRAVLRCIGRDASLPSTRSDLTVFAIRGSFKTHSSFQCPIGFGRVAARLVDWERLGFDHLCIPDVLVNCHGELTYVCADCVTESWAANRMLPISGPKSAYYIAFAESST